MHFVCETKRLSGLLEEGRRASFKKKKEKTRSGEGIGCGFRAGRGGGDGVCCLGRGQSLRSQNSERSRDPLSREWGGAGGGLVSLAGSTLCRDYKYVPGAL